MMPVSKWILPLYISTLLWTVPSPSHAATQPDTQLVASKQTHTSSPQSEQKRIAEQYDLHSTASSTDSSDYHPSYFVQIGDWGISTDNSTGSAIWRIAIALLQAL